MSDFHFIKKNFINVQLKHGTANLNINYLKLLVILNTSNSVFLLDNQKFF